MTHQHLSEMQFDQLAEELIYRATAKGTLPSDALAGMAKALGTLSAFIAMREGLSEEDVVKASQTAVADYARAASVYLRENADVAPFRIRLDAAPEGSCPR